MSYKLIFYFFLFAYFLYSQEDNDLIINLGSSINTTFDEFPIESDGEHLIFLRQEGENQNLYLWTISENKVIGKFLLPKEFHKYNIHSFSLFNSPNRKEILFSANLPKKLDSDIFIAEFDSIRKKFKIKAFPFNTKDFESHPRFSPDGNYFIFVSDREGALGGTDIMISYRQPDDPKNGWSAPEFLDSNINTKENEISPYIDEKGNLFFSRIEEQNYEIFKALSIDFARWSLPKKIFWVNQPSNNELFPVVINDKLFFASNRTVGAGGYDIWMMNLCFPVLLEINFTEQSSIFSAYNKLIIQEENGLLVEEKYIGSETQLLFPLLPRKTYRILIANECNHKRYFEKTITTICSDSEVVKYRVTIDIGNELTKDFQLPFFVTGYYKPNTKENLVSLRKLFDYKFIGYDDSTRFIEFPTDIYDSLAIEVDSAMKAIVTSIKYFLALFQKDCMPPRKRLLIQITGYSDPRGISESARFFEETIDDPLKNTFIRRGSRIDNFILSKLRAYYTAKMIEEEIRKDFAGELDISRIIWEIRAGGEIPPNPEDNFLHLRKVKVILNFVEQ